MYAREGEGAADQRAARLAKWSVGEEKFQGSDLGERESGGFQGVVCKGN